jgi:DNA-binding Lrp family transcriptional regulator
MNHSEKIITALRKLGPSAPFRIADRIGLTPSACSYRLSKMLKAGALKAGGTSLDRLYALPDQELEGAASAPPRKGNGKPKPAARQKPAAQAGDFLPAMTADMRLVIVNGAAPAVFTSEQTEAIAQVVLQHFET